MKSINIYKIAQSGTYLLFTLLLIYIAYKSLSDWYLWYDESGQFYISKGLNHYSEPFAPYSGIGDVIYYNRYFNLDPGGFSVLLHYWSMLSNHYVHLRLLPFLFFLASIFVAYKIGMQLFHDHFPAILLASVFLINPVILQLAGELRAYSMEMCGILISLYLLNKFKENLSISKLLILALILDVFMTSRYDFVIFAFAISLYLIFMIYKQYGFSAKAILPIVVYSCATLIGVAFVYFISMKYQNATAAPEWYLSYLGRDFRKLIFHTLSINFYIILGYVLLCHFRRIPQNFYVCISLLVSIIDIIFSFTNRSPWDERRTLAITICQFLAIGIMLLRHLNGRKIIFAMLLLSLYGFHRYKHSVSFVRQEEERGLIYKEMEFCINNKKCGEFIFISQWFSPNIRYFFEEYNWREKFPDAYPSYFIFGNTLSHNQTGDKLAIDVVTAENTDAHFYLSQIPLPSSHFELCKGHKYVYTRKTKRGQTNEKNTLIE